MVKKAKQLKLRWQVDPPPQGPYRSFDKRGWPDGQWPGGEPAIQITCEDGYTGRRARGEEAHAELRVHVADYRPIPGGGGFTWRRLQQPAATLKEAKTLAVKALNAHPEFWPDNYR